MCPLYPDPDSWCRREARLVQAVDGRRRGVSIIDHGSRVLALAGPPILPTPHSLSDHTRRENNNYQLVVFNVNVYLIAYNYNWKELNKSLSIDLAGKNIKRCSITKEIKL